MASTSSGNASQAVVFKTQTPYPLPSQKYMIPTSWKRYQLSQLVNKALSLAQPIPFDFLVRGEILTTSLIDWCAENGIGEEETLDIEYIESVLPPQKLSDIPHEEWVSSVLCNCEGYFLTGSYDGLIRAFDYSQKLVMSATAHSAPITSISVLPANGNEDSIYTIASASHDLTAQLTQVTLGPASVDTPISPKALASLHLHTSPLSSITFNEAGTHLLTSSWDGNIGLWDTTIPSKDEITEQHSIERDRKKRRTDEIGKPRKKAPLMVLKSHTARVSKVLFAPGTESKAYSCGFDSTVRVWDTENGICTHTISAAEKPFLDLVITPDGNNALVTSTDRTMSQYDLRSSEKPSVTSSIASFRHPATPSCLSVGSNNNQVVTGAYDGIVRLWDLRSVKSAVASFKAWDGRKKILSVDWKKGVVGIGGEGGLEIWKVGEDPS